jgi:flagellar assembly protein FliH
VFRPGEIALSDSTVVLEAPFKTEESEPEVDAALAPAEAEVYDGPTAEQLRAEAEQFKEQWDNEKQAMLHAARAEAELITNDARLQAEERMKVADEQVQATLEKAQTDARGIRQKAENDGNAFRAKSKADADAITTAAKKEGIEQGRAEGFEQGKAEVERLVQKTHLILERVQDKRGDIFEQAERQIVDLTLLIARKVVKVISQTEREVVVENVKAALSQVKAKGTIAVKVNMSDLKLTTEHLDEFTKMLEAGGKIELLEDNSVDVGGCAVETDYGELDARISSQLAELERAILALSPVVEKSASA